MRLLLDMNISPRLSALLAEFGLEAVHWGELGPADASDADIALRAAIDGFIVVSHDTDFGFLLAMSGARRPSVIQIRADGLRLEVLARLLVNAASTLAVELEAGALVTMDADRVRLRVLPFGRMQG